MKDIGKSAERTIVSTHENAIDFFCLSHPAAASACCRTCDGIDTGRCGARAVRVMCYVYKEKYIFEKIVLFLTCGKLQHQQRGSPAARTISPVGYWYVHRVSSAAVG